MTLRVGLIGFPISMSPSPAMQNAAFAALNIDAGYALMPTTDEELPSRIAMLRDAAFLGANVTIPHKQHVLPLLDELDESVERVGAVNTIVKRNGRLIGYNTDAQGLLRAIQETPLIPSFNGLIIGAGGAARAAIAAASMAGACQITIQARQNSAAAMLAATFQQQFPSVQYYASQTYEQDDTLANADIVIQTTPVGSVAQPGIPIREDAAACLKSQAILIDLITRDTPFLLAARARGIFAINGLPMLLYQGALAFELWTQQSAPLQQMREKLDVMQL